MSLVAAVVVALSCVVFTAPEPSCWSPSRPMEPAESRTDGPVRSPDALDVVITAQSAVAWEVASGAIMYEKNAAARRPIASLVKLLSVLTVRQHLKPEATVEIPAAVRTAQRRGAHIRLPAGHHASVQDLLAASLIASANDAIVSLAFASAGSEEMFVDVANAHAEKIGLASTKLTNATGLSGGEQYSTALDVRRLLTLAYQDPILRPYLKSERGRLVTAEGVIRDFTSTNDLLSTYLPVVAAKTGYTVEAEENVALLTHDAAGHTIGIVILGSRQRFQDAKVLAEWISRHYTWRP